MFCSMHPQGSRVPTSVLYLHVPKTNRTVLLLIAHSVWYWPITGMTFLAMWQPQFGVGDPRAASLHAGRVGYLELVHPQLLFGSFFADGSSVINHNYSKCSPGLTKP
jgi:hypothetical protein